MRHTDPAKKPVRGPLLARAQGDAACSRRSGSSLPLNARLLLSAGGLLGLALAGCGSKVNYTCTNNLCTASLPAAQLQLSAGAYTAGAGTIPAKLVVTRSGEGDGAVSVHFATSDGSGIAGVDYATSEGTLKWAAGDKTPRIVEISLKNQPMRRTSRSFAVRLSTPSEGATLGSVDSAVVTLEGDDRTAAK